MEWIKCSERMPVTGSLSLVVWAGVVQHTAYRRFGRGFACAEGYAWVTADGYGDIIEDAEITHWKPFPDPPEETA